MTNVMESPLIIDIKRGSIDDGDGIRTVIFFKGCPLDCAWCHNPESKSRSQEYFYDADRCLHCGRCYDFCPTGAFRPVGKRYTIDELVPVIREDMTYFGVSGGGVTFSGGEPALHMEFVGALAKQLRGMGISCALQTCGYFDCEKFSRLVLPYLDCILYDIKLFDPQKHIEYTGRDNRIILDNLRLLCEKDVKLVPRTPLIPGFTDSAENMSGILGLLGELGLAEKHRLLPYNPPGRKGQLLFPGALPLSAGVLA